MSSISGPAAAVLRGFIAAANAQYREAGLSDYQLKLRSDGTVTTKHRHAARFKAQSAASSSGTQQASDGAAATTTTSSSAAMTRSGAAPTISSLKPTDTGFALQWQAVTGAKQYGIWIDGALIGTVTNPQFAGTLDKGSSGVIQVDAVLTNGTRTALTTAVKLTRGSDGTVQASDPTAATSATAAELASSSSS